jgi:RNA polymerase sigma-70 factor, ECF subfamily
LLSQTTAATVARMDEAAASIVAAAPLDPESRAWVDSLALPSGPRDSAVARLHSYLLRVARFELNRRAASGQASVGEVSDLATQAADDALMAILRKLPDYRGDSRFTTWAAKFAILEASVKARRKAWQRAEVTLDADSWERFATTTAPFARLEQGQQLEAIGRGLQSALSPHQREILIAVTLDGVPIDVLAERLHSSRGAIYKTLHDARRNLRNHLTQGEER